MWKAEDMSRFLPPLVLKARSTFQRRHYYQITVREQWSLLHCSLHDYEFTGSEYLNVKSSTYILETVHTSAGQYEIPNPFLLQASSAGRALRLCVAIRDCYNVIFNTNISLPLDVAEER